jgi:adenylate cyclase
MDRVLEAYRDTLPAEIRFGRTRIGVNSGETLVGDFGGDQFFDYTAHGDAINIAARLESANRDLGTRICVSKTTASACSEVTFRPIGALTLKGIRRPVRTFEPVAEGETGRAPLQRYVEAFDLAESGRDEARGIFQRLATQFPLDPLVCLYNQRLGEGKKGVTIVPYRRNQRNNGGVTLN